jgi:hypothetical protein
MFNFSLLNQTARSGVAPTNQIVTPEHEFCAAMREVLAMAQGVSAMY